MFRFLLLSFFVACAYGSRLPPRPQFAMDWDRSGRVVGGQETTIEKHPHQVAALWGRVGGSYSQSCGGSIIRSDVVVTAAHCPYGDTASNWQVRAGSTNSREGGQVVAVQSYRSHPSFSYFTIDWDLSLFFLAQDIAIDGLTTRPIPLPAQDEPTSGGQMSWVTGWGSTREGGSTVAILQEVEIPVVDQQTCASAYQNINTITARMLCAGLIETGGKDACQGDSGGPLTINGVLFGVTSWGSGCARPRYPGVWARVPAFRDWIDQQL